MGMSYGQTLGVRKQNIVPDSCGAGQQYLCLCLVQICLPVKFPVQLAYVQDKHVCTLHMAVKCGKSTPSGSTMGARGLC